MPAGVSGFILYQILIFYVASFFMPKIILKIPDKNLGLLKITTFIKSPRQFLAQATPSIITQIAKTATKNRGGQKQLTSNPTAKVTEIMPLLERPRLRIFIPPLLPFTT